MDVRLTLYAIRRIMDVEDRDCRDRVVNESEAIMFEVDLVGLTKLIDDAGPGRLVCELVSNALDEDATRVDIEISWESRNLLSVCVVDDSPTGFRDLSHAWTLFAESYKKPDATKSGRFNLGDKLFLAASVMSGKPARILTTTGGVEFELVRGKPVRSHKRNKRDAGSMVGGYLKATKDQYEECLSLLRRLITAKPIVLNGQPLPTRKPVSTFTAKLPTVISDAEGAMRATRRQTTVELYEPIGEASVYELGVPVVATGDRWDVNVKQRVPLNFERDNVTPAYLRELRTHVLNAMHTVIKPEEASDQWVREATSDPRVSQEATKTVLDHRFGEKRVAYDPSDPEANAAATAAGFKVIHGRELNKDEWNNVREKAPVAAAGQAFPTQGAYTSAGGKCAEFVETWTDGMKRVARFTEWLHKLATGRDVYVRINASSTNFSACYIRESLELHYSVKVLGNKWFDNFGPTNYEKVLKLAIHEIGHYFSGNHLSEDYHEALCEIGTRLAQSIVNGMWFRDW